MQIHWKERVDKHKILVGEVFNMNFQKIYYLIQKDKHLMFDVHPILPIIINYS